MSKLNSRNASEAAPLGTLAASSLKSYARALYRLLARRLPRPEDIDDVVQEAFLRMLKVPEDKFVRDPQAYLFGIACKVAHDFRVRARDPRVAFDSEVVDARADHPPYVQADELGDWIGAQRQVECALEQLTPLQLKIVIGECRDGLTHTELAAQLGLSVHTVKKYAVQALARIRSDWDDCK
jgi:RNA polymerase sigma factor (sigma-70 family)